MSAHDGMEEGTAAVKRMTYMSTFARPLSDGELADLGDHSARRNAVDDITGVLMTLGPLFFQVIEGPEDAIDDLYARVLRDDRHVDIICLRTERDIEQRLFPDWSMNLFALDRIEGDVVKALRLVLARMGEAQHIIERYTQPAVSRIIAQGLDPTEVPLRKVERVVLFTDMVAFSAISDRLPIEEVSELVTAYLEACSTAIAHRGGEVTKFLGDGVMAYFADESADDAVQSCVDIQHELARIRSDAPPRSALRLLHSGFGLALGPVLEGSMGSSVKMDYTIIGEPVNTAARLEALTRTLDSPVLMTSAVAEALARSWDIDVVGTFDVGRDEATTVYGLAPVGPATADMRAAVAQGLDMLASEPGAG